MPKTDAPISWLSKFSVLIFLFACSACSHSRPSVEYVLAREAFNSAREVESARYAPGYYHRAEEAYRKGIQNYQERYFDESVEYFKEARTYAEKAENAAHVQRMKAGEEAL